MGRPIAIGAAPSWSETTWTSRPIAPLDQRDLGAAWPTALIFAKKELPPVRYRSSGGEFWGEKAAPSCGQVDARTEGVAGCREAEEGLSLQEKGHHDGRTDEWREGVDGQGADEPREAREEQTKQTEQGTKEES